jgi:transmembrane sensor
MTESSSASEIDEEAAAWAVRVDGRGLDESRDPDLQAWLAGDHRRAGAFLRAQAALSFLDRGRVLAETDAWPEPRRRGPSRRSVLIAGGGGLVAASAAGVAFLVLDRRRYNTALGEIRQLPLQDGSLAVMNTQTAVDIAMNAKSRQINLRRGEAWFEVAKDAQRPFVVQAGAVRVRAVGTAFSVRRLDQGANVMVTEGVVETWLVGDDRPPTRVGSGAAVHVAAAAPREPFATATDIEHRLSWRTGQISLNGESLGDAALEFNRYNQRRIVIEDPDLASKRFVGLFRTNEPESFAAAVAATVGARVTEDGNEIRLSRPA